MSIVGIAMQEAYSWLDYGRKHDRRAEAALKYDSVTNGVLAEIARLPNEQRFRISKELTLAEGDFLLGISASAATASVTEGEPQRLRYGLLALLVENGRREVAITLTELSLLLNSARKLNVSLADEYALVAHLAHEPSRSAFRKYFDQGGLTLAQVGYRECLDRNREFSYEQIR